MIMVFQGAMWAIVGTKHDPYCLHEYRIIVHDSQAEQSFCCSTGDGVMGIVKPVS